MNIDEPGLTGRILGAAFEVSNTLGAGFLEKVYARALLQELKLRGIGAVAAASFRVIYKGQCVGEYFADILVENAVNRAQVCGPACQRARGSMPELSPRLRHGTLSALQLPKADRRMETHRSFRRIATKRGDRRLTEEIHVLGYYI